MSTKLKQLLKTIQKEKLPRPELCVRLGCPTERYSKVGRRTGSIRLTGVTDPYNNRSK